jgi:CRISPR-associated endonuclease/helicase Cas3
MLNIITLPVYSKLATEELPVEVQRRLPAGLRLHEHQLETYRALTGGQYDVVINTAMTGDGKSLAGYLPALVSGATVAALYPTNELARDQEMQMARMKADWGARFGYGRVSAARLEEMVHEMGLTRKAEALEQALANQDVVLTNPDIFHYIAQFYYTRVEDAPDRILGRRLIGGYDQFTFDEFHIFDAPQVVSVVNALLLIRQIAGTAPLDFGHGRKRFLFLSATPGEQLTDYLHRAGFDVHLVTTEGRYHHGGEPDGTPWRRIVHGSDIAFAAQTAEEWVEAHLEDTLLPFFLDHRPAAKGAIIVNSVAAAHRLAARLKRAFQENSLTSDLTVETNTGLTSDALRKVSRESDLLVGTSTVDVGIDFRINLLIFESRDTGTFLQRLGRLGRHTTDDSNRPFERFQAYALVPNFVLERLSPGRLEEGGVYTREELADLIRAVYPPPAQFPLYAREWGRLQCAHVLRSLSRKTVYPTYTDTRSALVSLYWKTFKINAREAREEYEALLADKQQPLLDEARSFRGGSPLQCGLINLTESPPTAQRYNLLSLAANGELSWLDRQEFDDELKKRQIRPSFPLDDLAGFFLFHGFAERRRRLDIHVNHQVDDWSADRWGRPIILDRIELDGDNLDWLGALNSHLRRRKLVVTMCQTAAADLRYRVYLPPFFELYNFRSMDGRVGAIAFARQALLLHVAMQQRGYDCGGGPMIY